MKYHHLDEHLWFQSFADSPVSNAEKIAQLIAVNWGFTYFKLQILERRAFEQHQWVFGESKNCPRCPGAKISSKPLPTFSTTQNPENNITNMTFFNHPSGLPEKSFALSDCWPKTCSVYHIQDAIQDAISLVLVFPWFFVTVVAKDITYLPWKAGKLNCEVWPWFLSFIWLLVHWYTSMSWWFISCS